MKFRDSEGRLNATIISGLATVAILGGAYGLSYLVAVGIVPFP